MKFILNDCRLEKETYCGDYMPLVHLLNESYNHWNYGSGDSAISLPNQTIGLIFFKTIQGIFIEDFATTTVPLIRQSPATTTVTHYVGGNPLVIPHNCLMDTQTALEIIQYFVETNGNLHPGFEWIDIYESIPLSDNTISGEEIENNKNE